MPRNNTTPTRTRRSALRLSTIADIKQWVKGQIELYKEDEAERLERANAARNEGQYIDAATFLGVAAKKKIVRQKLTKLLNAMA